MKNCLKRKVMYWFEAVSKFTNRSSIVVGTEKADSFKLIALNQREPGLCVMASCGRHYVRMKHNCYPRINEALQYQKPIPERGRQRILIRLEISRKFHYTLRYVKLDIRTSAINLRHRGLQEQSAEKACNA